MFCVFYFNKDGGGPSHEHDHEKHPFSEPWEDSDLILVVEDDKFHVHRQILSIHSPVFKAMLNSQFKEATAKEIPLPGKKASEFLDFLKQLYVKENAGVTSKGLTELCLQLYPHTHKSAWIRYTLSNVPYFLN